MIHCIFGKYFKVTFLKANFDELAFQNKTKKQLLETIFIVNSSCENNY